MESTVFRSIGYDPASSQLEVAFRHGYLYVFRLVPRNVFLRFLKAASKGAFFDQELRNGPYSSERLSQGPAQ